MNKQCNDDKQSISSKKKKSRELSGRNNKCVEQKCHSLCKARKIHKQTKASEKKRIKVHQQECQLNGT